MNSGLTFFGTLLLALAPGVPAQATGPAGPHEFVFRDLDGTEIEVFAVAGKRCVSNPCETVIAIHGLNRNAASMRKAWRKAADDSDLLVLAPLFDTQRFPTRRFQHGGVSGEPDRNKWLFSTVDRLFEHQVRAGRAKPGGFTLYGHSAGAQFAHRYALFMPDGKAREIIAANAGFYTLPTGREGAGGFSYPYSLEGTPIDAAARRIALARRVHVMLGDQDNDPNHHQLNTSEGAKVQGPHRLARGQFFFAAAKAEAAKLGAPFNWKVTVVPGVAHDNPGMAEAAAALLAKSKR